MAVSMMILADTAGTIISLVVGALFVGAWILSALASAKTKKRRTTEGAASWQDILKELSGAASGQQTHTPRPPPMPAQPMPAQPVRQQAQQRQQQRPQQQQRRQKGRKQRPAPAQPAVPAQRVEEVEQVVHPAAVPATGASAPSTAGRPAIANLLTRQNLRNQIILSEILQPPLSLRGDPRL